MVTPILMPQVGQDLTEGKLVELKVNVGDVVAKGDVVATVESEKASFEVEAFEAGVVVDILYSEGDTTTVLEPLMFVGEPGEKAARPAASGAKTENGSGAPEKASATARPNSGKRSSSPLARRLAHQNGLDLSEIPGSGPHGIIIKRDIEKAIVELATEAADTSIQAAPPPSGQVVPEAPAAARPPPVPLPSLAREDREEPFDRMRQVIADRLVAAKQTVPHFYLRAEADVTDLMNRRRTHVDSGGDKLSINDVVVRSTALTLLEFPRLNAHVANDRIVLKSRVNIGVAVSVDNGLMVPVVADADRKSISEIAKLVRDYAAAARRGISKSTEAGTFSISNLGMYGVEVFPIINPPESGILGVGPVGRQIREHRGGIHGRDIMTMMLSGDHRAVDGAYGARFLNRLVETIESYSFDE